MVVAAFTDQWESSCTCRLKRFIMIRHMVDQPIYSNLHAIMRK
jgi:hypothetical protein